MHDRVYCTPTLRALSYFFVVLCDGEVVHTHVSALLSSLIDAHDGGADAVGEQAPHCYTLKTSTERPATVDVGRDGEPVGSGLELGVAVAWLVWDVNRLAAELSGEHLLFHAGGVEASGVGILMPGASGSGKSTLTAGLVRAGLGYLSDELVALELDAAGSGPDRLVPYPKPITVKSGSFGVLADLTPAFLDGEDDGEWLVPVGDDTGRRVGDPCQPGFVIVPRYDPSAETALVPLTDTEAFFTLALHAVNLLSHGPAGSEAIGRLAAHCASFSLAFSDLDAACKLVLGLVGAGV